MERNETLEGYVIDMACVRKYPRDELLERSRTHTKECALMGHCVESGYALVDEEGRIATLDTEATPEVVRVVRQSGRDRGIRLRAKRERAEEASEMRTTAVDEV